MSKNLPIEKLQGLPGVWRVDRIGKMVSPASSATNIEVHFSGIDRTFLNDPYNKNALRDNQRLTLKFPTSSLFRLRTGALWAMGQLLQSAPLMGHYLIDLSTIQFRKLNEAFTIDGLRIQTVVPEQYYKCNSERNDCADSWYAIVNVIGRKDTQYLVVPCAELVSFYYGASSRLISSVLRGDTQNLVNWEKSFVINNFPSLSVKIPLSRLEAITLCRALSDFSKLAMQSIHKWLKATHVDNNNDLNQARDKKPLFIKAGFPFKGRTTLLVRGKQISIGVSPDDPQKKIWAVFAMQIAECHHPIEFEHPEVVHDETFRYGTASAFGSGIPQESPIIPDEIRDTPIFASPVNARFKRTAILEPDCPFAGTGSIRFRHRWAGEKPGGAGAPFRIGPDGQPIDKLSTGEGSYAKDFESTLGVSFFKSIMLSKNRKLTDFIAMLEQLTALTKDVPFEWGISIRTLGETEKGQLASFPSDLGVKRSWHHFVDGGKHRTRKVVIAEINLMKDNEFIYLLELELKANETGQCTVIVYKKNLGKIEDQEFTTLLKLTAIKRRWIKKQYNWDHADGSQWEKYRDEASGFFKNNEVQRLPHSSAIREKKDTRSPENSAQLQKAATAKLIRQIDAEQWANFILANVKICLKKVGRHVVDNSNSKIK